MRVETHPHLELLHFKLDRLPYVFEGFIFKNDHHLDVSEGVDFKNDPRRDVSEGFAGENDRYKYVRVGIIFKNDRFLHVQEGFHFKNDRFPYVWKGRNGIVMRANLGGSGLGAMSYVRLMGSSVFPMNDTISLRDSVES